jgi:hypothetical protein
LRKGKRSAQESLQNRDDVRASRNHQAMLQLTVVCSSCAEETEAVVESLEDIERDVCPCGYSYVVLSIAEFEAVEIAGGEVIELRRRDERRLAA